MKIPDSMDLQPNRCVQCKKSISDKRPDSKYCSARCRMRYKRDIHKKKRILELIAISSQIPNDSVQMNGKVTHIKDDTQLSGKAPWLPVEVLNKTTIAEIERLISAKKLKISGEALVFLFKNWIK